MPARALQRPVSDWGGLEETPPGDDPAGFQLATLRLKPRAFARPPKIPIVPRQSCNCAARTEQLHERFQLPDRSLLVQPYFSEGAVTLR
jgi:hypothetical protein